MVGSSHILLLVCTAVMICTDPKESFDYRNIAFPVGQRQKYNTEIKLQYSLISGAL